LPSTRSRLFNGLARRAVKSMFVEFDHLKVRGKLALIDRVFPEPRGVRIKDCALSRCAAQWIRPNSDTDRVILYLPGGAWVLRSPGVHRRLAARLARDANANVLLVFYRLAPEEPFPAGLDDCVEGYEALLSDGIDPSRVVIGGDSAGGNLTLATLLVLRDRGLPQPAGAFALSPCTDMEMRDGDPRFVQDHPDPLFPSLGQRDGDPRLLYAGGDEKLLQHPYCSPLRGDLRGLCRLLVQVGSTERLLSDSTEFVKRAQQAGVDAEVEVWEGQPHVWHGVPLPETKQAFAHLGDFVRRCCP
jgi:epsilon-lactone hydrolase